MFKKINFILVLLLLFVSVTAVSAVDDTNDTVGIDEAISDISDSKEVLTFDEDILSSSSHTVNQTSYYNYLMQIVVS